VINCFLRSERQNTSKPIPHNPCPEGTVWSPQLQNCVEEGKAPE